MTTDKEVIAHRQQREAVARWMRAALDARREGRTWSSFNPYA
jgi:hypothetical protein